MHPAGIDTFANTFDEAASHQTMHETVNCRLAQTRAIHQFAQRQGLAFVAKRMNNFTGANHSVRIAAISHQSLTSLFHVAARGTRMAEYHRRG
jgi:hypothetical protein